MVRSLPDGVEPTHVRRRLGRVEFQVTLLDLTSPAVQQALGVSAEQLMSDDLTVCEAIADLAAEAGFEAVLGPSAALGGETTLAVFGPAIERNATKIVDEGARGAKGQLAPIRRRRR